MPRIHVCSLARMPRAIVETGADHVLSLMSEDVARPAAIAPGRHLYIKVSDIVAPMEGTTLPMDAHIRQALDFVRGWDRAKPMIVHCWAGVSRSTASAFIAACALRPDLDEGHLARLIRERSPTATPNSRFVALADAMLGRGGRMIAAVEAIGRGADCTEGEPFHLDLGPRGP